jgi:uncharacterized protein YxeA
MEGGKGKYAGVIAGAIVLTTLSSILVSLNTGEGGRRSCTDWYCWCCWACTQKERRIEHCNGVECRAPLVHQQHDGKEIEMDTKQRIKNAMSIKKAKYRGSGRFSDYGYSCQHDGKAEGLLRLEKRIPKVFEPYQMLGEVEDDCVKQSEWRQSRYGTRHDVWVREQRMETMGCSVGTNRFGRR